MHRGYVRLWRKALDSGILSNADAWQVFGYLILNASHKDYKMLVGTTPVQLKPGQLVTGRNKLAQNLSSTQRKVRTALATLQNMGIIDQQATNKYTIISIINWHRYQEQQYADDQQDGQQATSTRPAPDQHPTTNNNIEHKNIEEDLNTICSEPENPAHEPPKPKPKKPVSPPAVNIPPIPCLRQQEYQTTEDDLSAWREAYPAVDVPLAIAQAREWCLSNPHKRKTFNGARRFITNWLAREQNNGRASPPYQQQLSHSSSGEADKNYYLQNSGRMRTTVYEQPPLPEREY